MPQVHVGAVYCLSLLSVHTDVFILQPSIQPSGPLWLFNHFLFLVLFKRGIIPFFQKWTQFPLVSMKCLQRVSLKTPQGHTTTTPFQLCLWSCVHSSWFNRSGVRNLTHLHPHFLQAIPFLKLPLQFCAPHYSSTAKGAKWKN